MMLLFACAQPALAEKPVDAPESDESIELRTMGPRERIVLSQCDEPFPGEGINAAGSCVPLTLPLLASLRGVTRSRAVEILGASGHAWQDHLYFYGNYANGLRSRTEGDTGKLTLIFEDKKVVEVWAALRWSPKDYVYDWQHYAGQDESFCVDSSGTDKPCKPRS